MGTDARFRCEIGFCEAAASEYRRERLVSVEYEEESSGWIECSSINLLYAGRAAAIVG